MPSGVNTRLSGTAPTSMVLSSVPAVSNRNTLPLLVAVEALTATATMPFLIATLLTSFDEPGVPVNVIV